MRISPAQSVEISPDITVGDGKLTFFCGPCVVESRDSALYHAGFLKEVSEKTGARIVYKSSFEKANRTSSSSFRGPGLDEGLRILEEVKKETGFSLITDIHEVEQIDSVSQVVDVLQVPAFLCRQTKLLEASGRTGKPVMIKKGQFLHPSDMAFAAEKVVKAGGNSSVLFCERGSCFGYRDLVVDFRGLGQMREIGWPVVFDATHSVQQMGSGSGVSGGQKQFVVPLARASVAFGVDAIFMEVHKEPQNALSDGPNMIELERTQGIIRDLESLQRSRCDLD